MRIAIMHRFPLKDIKQTNAAIGYMLSDDVKSVLTFKKFNRLNAVTKLLKSIIWIFYAPLLILFNKRYDIIYCDDSFPFYPALIKLVSPKSKVVVRLGDLHLMYYCSGITYKFLHWLEKKEWDMVDAIFSISKTMTEYLRKETKTKIVTILDPVDPMYFPIEKSEYRKIVMFHGLLTKNKNVDIIIHAAEYFRQYKDVVFWIIGDGPDRNRLMKMSGSNVLFLGWQPFENICQYINQCAIGIAARSDNVGNDYVVTSPFLQYGVMGKPCIVSRRKVFEDLNYKWIFDWSSDLAERIEELLAKPEEGKHIRRYILDNHNAKNIGRKILWELKRV